MKELLLGSAASLAAPEPRLRKSPLSRRSYSISEFCQTEGFSRGYYYGTLKKLGLNPDETRPGGNTVRITEEARARWHKRHTVKPTKLETAS